MSAMPAKLDARAKELFAAAIERPEGERAAFLEQACSGDAALRRQVETLLHSLGEAEQRFEDPVRSPGEQPGDHIGHYKLRQKIGEGGFGVVWMAEQEQPVRRMVALKVLKPGMDTAQVIGRFEAERQALALMDHPSIAKVFDGGATPTGRPYFVMELVKGMPITSYCDGAGLGVEERLQLFIPVCQAVQHAHQKGVIHRDLKPSNVLVTLHDGVAVPKVIDFGIAKAARGALTQHTVFTEFRQMLGTPEYMAPEQADLSALDIDTRADVYSLGVLLYELLTGTRPFELKTLMEAGYAEMLRTIREVDPPKPSTRVSTLGEQVSDIAKHRRVPVRSLGSLLRGDLDWIVMKALEKERGRRYETASALAEDVLRHLQHEPVRASPPSRRYRMGKYLQRHRLGVLASGAVAASLVIGTIAAGLGYAEAKEQARRARGAESLAKDERAAAVLSAAEALRQKEAAQQAAEEAQAQSQLAEAQSMMACAERNKAEAVVALMTSILASGDPHETKDKDYPVRLVLDDFERNSVAALKQIPEVEAVLRRMLGRSYLGLGLAAKAEPHLLRATALRREVYGSAHPFVAQSLSDESSLRHAQGRFGEAVKLLQQAMLALPEEPGEADQDPVAGGGDRMGPGDERMLRVESLQGLCDNLRHLGDLDGAEAAGRAACRLAEQHAGNDSTLALDCGASLALVFLDADGRSAEAEPLLRAALARHREEGGDFSKSLNNLGSCLMLLKRYEEAGPLLREALEREEQLFGRGDPATAAYMSNLAVCELELRRWKEAEALQRRSLELQRRLSSPDDPEVSYNFGLLGRILEASGQIVDAEHLWRDREAELAEVVGPESPEVANVLGRLGLCVASRRDFAEAEALALRAQEILMHVEGAQSPETANSWRQLAQIHAACEAWDDAARCNQQALALLGQHAGDEEAADILAALARANFQRGEVDLAVEEQRSAVERMERGHAQPEKLAPQKQRFASYLMSAGRAAEAEPLAREATESLRSLFPATHRDVCVAESTYAKILADLGRFEDAKLLLRGVLERTEGDGRHEDLAALANILLLQDRGAEAEPLARECLAIRERTMTGQWPHYSAIGLVGDALRAQGRLAEAEPMLREAAGQMPDVPAVRRRALPETYRRLIRLYEAQGRAAEAATWRARLEALPRR